MWRARIHICQFRVKPNIRKKERKQMRKNLVPEQMHNKDAKKKQSTENILLKLFSFFFVASDKQGRYLATHFEPSTSKNFHLVHKRWGIFLSIDSIFVIIQRRFSVTRTNTYEITFFTKKYAKYPCRSFQKDAPQSINILLWKWTCTDCLQMINKY